MTFQNLCSIFNCTHEESLAIWDYLMFLRVKGMLKQPPIPAITKEDMQFEASREASPLTTQRWVASILGVPVELTNAKELDQPKVHIGTQQWFDDMEAIRQGKKPPGDTAPPLSALADQIREDLKKEKAAALAFKLTSEPLSKPLTQAEEREEKRKRNMQAQVDAWKNCVVGTSKVGAIHEDHISPLDLQMIQCDRCKMELYFGKVPDGTDIVCFGCGFMTKFNYEEGAAQYPAGDELVDRAVGIRRQAAANIFADDCCVILCDKCRKELHFHSACNRVNVTCYSCGHLTQWKAV